MNKTKEKLKKINKTANEMVGTILSEHPEWEYDPQPEDTDNPRKNFPIYRGVCKYFPNAIKAVSEVSLQGSKQHHPEEPMHWDRDKSTDDADALMRHLIDHASGEKVDDDGMLHLQKVAWRSLALLEKELESCSTKN